ncbi:MAG: hypothetical protein PVG93_06835, partial [Phycisphaerales bacterium]
LLNNIEKIVLAIVGLICLVLLVTKVLISSNYAEYEGKKLGPGEIDSYIQKQAEELEMSLNVAPEKKMPPEKQLDKFVAKFNSAFSAPANLAFPAPDNIGDSEEIGEYGVPVIAQVKNAQAEHIRAVAYIPKEEIGPDNTYASSETEPNDLDLVTVEAKLDVAEVYKSFYETYTGDAINPQWRDPCLAVPVFAAVELQRQEIQDDGQWSSWQRVPRAKIDHMRELLKIIEDVEELPRGGMKVRQLQFDKIEVATNLLQPEGYQIGSAEEDWFPPTLHRQFLKRLAEQKVAERRQKLAEEKAQRESELERARSSRSDRRRSIESDPGGMGGFNPSLGGGGGGSSSRSSRSRDRSDRDRRREREEREQTRTKEHKEKETINDVYEEFEELRIDDKTDFKNMEQDLLFWAHDDTAASGKTYRYRIRIGFFNPLAGSNRFTQGNENFKDKVILWSSFSETKPLEIPSRLYFFPTGIQKAANIVKVEVAKYAMGYWYSNEFAVEQGEVIGKVVDQKPTEEEQKNNVIIPEQVDYTTGAMLIDAMSVDDWVGSKTLRPRQYFNMYYSYDGMNMESIPIEQRYWASDTQNMYNEIRNSIKQPKEPLRAWGGQIKGRESGFTQPEGGYVPIGPEGGYLPIGPGF